MRLIIYLMVGIILAACSPVTPYAPAPTSLPTERATATSQPTLIPQPTGTASPLDRYLQKIGDIAAKCRPLYDREPQTDSTLENWPGYDCRDSQELFIIKRDGSKAWEIGFDQFINYKNAPDDVYLLHQSSDHRYLYFVTTGPCCWDPGVPFLGQPLDDVWQFDMMTGLPPTNIMTGFDAAYFSPDDKTVLFIPQMSAPPPVIHFYDLHSHKILHRMVLAGFPHNASTGMVVWAPDGKEFAVLTVSGGDYELYKEGDKYKKELSSVVVVNMNTLSQRVIISESKTSISIYEITDANILHFSCYDYRENGSSVRTDQQYDLKSNKLLLPVPCP